MADSFKVRPTNPTGMTVKVTRGVGFIYAPSDEPTAIDGVVGLDDRSGYKPLLLEADQTLTVPPNSSGSTRYDIIEACYSRRTENSSSRMVLDPVTQQFTATGLNKTLAVANDGRTGQVTSPALSTADISYKIGGTNSASRPAVTPGYVKLADVVVANGATHITPNCIGDERSLLTPDNSIRIRGVVGLASGAANALTYAAPPGVEVYGVQSEFGALAILAGQADYFVVVLTTIANTPTVCRVGDSSGITGINSGVSDPSALPSPRDASPGLAKGTSLVMIDFGSATGSVSFEVILTPKNGGAPPVYT
jgi:hypothetical protein